MDGSSKHKEWSELCSDDQVYSLGESADSETLSKVSIGVQESDSLGQGCNSRDG